MCFFFSEKNTQNKRLCWESWAQPSVVKALKLSAMVRDDDGIQHDLIDFCTIDEVIATVQWENFKLVFFSFVFFLYYFKVF